VRLYLVLAISRCRTHLMPLAAVAVVVVAATTLVANWVSLDVSRLLEEIETPAEYLQRAARTLRRV
jgi:hypothetical protein